MPEPLQPSLRVRFALEPYPYVSPTIYRWAIEALADAEFTEGRLTVDGYTDIERALSGSDGHFAGASFSFTTEDGDRAISALLQAEATHYFLNREASLQLLSQAGRAAGLPWRTLFRGHITDAQETDDLRARFDLRDIIGSEFSTLNLDRAIARTMITRAAFPTAPEGVVGTPYYLPFGEHSDQGATDQNGNPAEKGMIPLRFLGWAAVGDSGVQEFWPGRRAYAFLAVRAQPVDGDTVTVDGVVYTFEAVFSDTAFKVLIGATVYLTAEGLARAIRATVGGGTQYGVGTTPHPTVDADFWVTAAENVTGEDVIVVYSHAPGEALNGAGVSATSVEFVWYHEGGIETTTMKGGSEPALLPPVVNAPTITATVLGTPGTTRYVYAVSAITATGETRACPDVEVLTGPAVLNTTDKISLQIVPPINFLTTTVIGYRVLGRAQTSTHLVLLNNGGTWIDPETTYVDDGTASEQTPGAPAVSTAIFDVLDEDNLPVNAYAMFGGLLGAVRITKLFVSDVGGGGATRTEPKRVTIAQELLAEAMTPHQDDGTANPRWPHADPWVVRDGIRSTLIYMSGPRAQDAIDGRVTVAANLCGYDASGNQTGPVVDGAFPVLQLLLNEFVLKNGGEGYTDGAFGPLQTFEDGTAMLRTSAFTAAQATTATFLTGGYKAAFCISDPGLTLRQLIQKFCQDFDCWVGINEHGQVHPVVLNPALSAAAVGLPFREDIEIAAIHAPTRAWPEIVNKITYTLDWDTDGRRYRYPPAEVLRPLSREGYKGPYREQRIDGWCTRDAATIADATNRRADRLSTLPVYWRWESDIAGIEVQLGSLALLTHARYGLVGRPVMVTKLRFSPVTTRVMFTGLDVAHVMAA